MHKVAFVVAAAVSLFALDLRAAELHISGVGDFKPRPATLTARRLDANVAPISIENLQIPGAASVQLGTGLWEVRLTASDVWSPPIIIRDGDSTEVRVWPTGVLRGQSNGVKTLRAQFTSLDPDGPAGEVDCEVDLGSWTCKFPIGRHNLRFSSPGCAPEFRFGVRVPDESGKATTSLNFTAGASLSGTLSTPRGVKTSLEGVEISLAPAGIEEIGRPTTTKANAKGFFQFKGLSPGDYTIRARKEGLTAQRQAVKVFAGTAAVLSEPLLLDRPKRLTVSVMPPLDPSSIPWRVRLYSDDSRSNHLSTVSESIVSPQGNWTQTGLSEGTYFVEVRSGNGNVWKSEEVTIGQEDVTLPIGVLAETIRGRITLGDKPLVASLSFGGEGRSTLRSDEDGRFEGKIPPGDGDQLRILVEADTPTVKRTILAKPVRSESGELHLDIDLPATTLMGRVINEDGSAEPYAILTVNRLQPFVHEQTFSESDGGFQIAGLEPGTYELTANGFERESKPAFIEVKKDAPFEVELILLREQHVRGRMVVGNTPVIHADVWAFPLDSFIRGAAPERTNERGEFLLRLPPGTTTYDILATHPAFDVVIGRASIEKGNLVIQVRQIGGTLIVQSPSTDDLKLKLDGAEIWLSFARDAGGAVEPGRVTFPRLEAGQYAVCSTKSQKCVSGLVPPHGTLTLSID